MSRERAPSPVWTGLLGLWVAAKTAVVLMAFIAFFVETVDLLRMSGSADATVVALEAKTGHRHPSRIQPIVTYNYTVEEREYQASRLLPGFLGNWGRFHGGEEFLRKYHIGQKVRIVYSPSNPGHAALLRGYFTQSICFPLMIAGVAAFLFCPRLPPVQSMLAHSLAACATLYGLIMGIYFLPVIGLSELGWFILGFLASWLCCLGVFALSYWTTGRIPLVPQTW